MDKHLRREHILKNERLLKEANREIERYAREDGEHGILRDETELEFFCACGQPECNARLLLTLAEYEAATARPNRFIVALGHDDPAIERVVEMHPTYAVVEKLA